jgi:Na+-transporting methylmalonyl-CoA/oxaloacetate decarboxylase gamma subunit
MEEKMTIVFLILFFLISFFMYLIIVGGNLSKSDYERKIEDEEQLNYLNEYNKNKYGGN